MWVLSCLLLPSLCYMLAHCLILKWCLGGWVGKESSCFFVSEAVGKSCFQFIEPGLQHFDEMCTCVVLCFMWNFQKRLPHQFSRKWQHRSKQQAHQHLPPPSLSPFLPPSLPPFPVSLWSNKKFILSLSLFLSSWSNPTIEHWVTDLHRWFFKRNSAGLCCRCSIDRQWRGRTCLLTLCSCSHS